MARLSPNHHEVDCSVQRGHFLTRAEAAQQVGMPAPELVGESGAVRISGPYGVEEVYPDWQFGPQGGFVEGLPEVVAELAGYVPGTRMAGFLLAPQPELGGSSVIEWLATHTSGEALEITP